MYFKPEEFACKHTLKAELQEIYGRFLSLDVKKRYVGLLKWYDGQPTNDMLLMGLDVKKSNTIQLCKDAQKELAVTILKGEDVNPVFEKYYRLVKSSQDINLFKMSSKLEKQPNQYLRTNKKTGKQVQMNTPAIRAVTWSNEYLKTQFRGGTKFYLLYIEKLRETQPDVIAFEDVSQLDGLKIKIDKEKYIDDLYGKIDNLIRGIPSLKKLNDGYHLRFKTNQQSLFSFISQPQIQYQRVKQNDI